MKNLKFSTRSINNLVGVNPRLIMFSAELLNIMMLRKVQGDPYSDFFINEGFRFEKKQKEYLRKKVSWIKHSKHQDFEAIDILPYPYNLRTLEKDLKLIHKIIKENDLLEKYGIESLFNLFQKDLPHFQTQKKYRTTKNILKTFLREL